MSISFKTTISFTVNWTSGICGWGELFTVNLLCRNFFWEQSSMWPEELGEGPMTPVVPTNSIWRTGPTNLELSWWGFRGYYKDLQIYMHCFTNVLIFVGTHASVGARLVLQPIPCHAYWKDLKVPSIIALAGDDHIVWDPGCEDKFLLPLVRLGFGPGDMLIRPETYFYENFDFKSWVSQTLEG